MKDSVNIFKSFVNSSKKIVIMTDTSALMQNDSRYVFSKVLYPIIHDSNNKLFIPKSVYNEVQKQSIGLEQRKIANLIIDAYLKYSVLAVDSKTQDVDFADNAIIADIVRLRINYDIVLITNDSALAQDVLNQNNAYSVNTSKKIKVFKVQNNTFVEIQKENNYSAKKPTKNSSSFSKNVQVKQIFDTNYLNAKMNDSLIKAVEVPELGGSIRDQFGKVHKLISEIGKGGEANVYKTDSGFICKIYKNDKSTKFKKEKIKLLINAKLEIKNMSFPQALVVNDYGEFLGYLMPIAQGIPLRYVYNPKYLNKYFSNWDRLQLAKIALNIAKKVRDIHNVGIILGDLNPLNILVKDENEIFFIDTDSYQINDYPCPVGMPPYTRRTRFGIRYEEYLRKKDDDIYALCVIVFQILMIGQHPYNYQGGGEAKDNYHPKNFPYRTSKKGSNSLKSPKGYYKNIWTHLPKKLKNIFEVVFVDEKACLIDELIKELSSYIYQLEQGYQERDIFPEYIKVIDQDGKTVNEVEFIKCSVCGRDFKVSKDYALRLRKTRQKPICTICEVRIKRCSEKGCQNIVENGQSLCKHHLGTMHQCSECGRDFLFTQSEKEFFDTKGLSYPKKCEFHRKSSKTQNYEQNKSINSAYVNSTSVKIKDTRSLLAKIFKLVRKIK